MFFNKDAFLVFSFLHFAIHIPAVMTMESVAQTQYRAAGP